MLRRRSRASSAPSSPPLAKHSSQESRVCSGSVSDSDRTATAARLVLAVDSDRTVFFSPPSPPQGGEEETQPPSRIPTYYGTVGEGRPTGFDKPLPASGVTRRSGASGTKSGGTATATTAASTSTTTAAADADWLNPYSKEDVLTPTYNPTPSDDNYRDYSDDAYVNDKYDERLTNTQPSRQQPRQPHRQELSKQPARTSSTTYFLLAGVVLICYVVFSGSSSHHGARSTSMRFESVVEGENFYQAKLDFKGVVESNDRAEKPLRVVIVGVGSAGYAAARAHVDHFALDLMAIERDDPSFGKVCHVVNAPSATNRAHADIIEYLDVAYTKSPCDAIAVVFDTTVNGDVVSDLNSLSSNMLDSTDQYLKGRSCKNSAVLVVIRIEESDYNSYAAAGPTYVTKAMYDDLGLDGRMRKRLPEPVYFVP